jgi:hypothetical protein
VRPQRARMVRPRPGLLVAAASLITLAASGATTSVVGAGHIASAPSLIAAGGSSAASGNCSEAEAREAVRRLGLGHPELADPVYKVLCGAFTGPASQTMVVSLLGPGSLGVIDWVVFRWAEGEWQLLMRRHQAAVLTAAGSDIRETVFVFRPGDPRCCPSGGTRSRIWHWNGTRFTAGPWKQAAKAESRGRSFYSPSRGIECGISDERRLRAAACHTHRPPQKATVDVNGRVTICRGSAARCRLGNIGEAPVLPYGKEVSVGRFRCLSLRSGMACTLIQTGKGFLINRKGVTRIRP